MRNRVFGWIIAIGILGGCYQAWSFYVHHGARIAESFSYRYGQLTGRKPLQPLTGAISIGPGYVAALRGGGELWGWGDNSAKQLGLANVRNLPVPKPLAEGRYWRYVYGGNTAIYAIAPGGHLWRREFLNESWVKERFFAQRVELKPLFSRRLWRKVLESQGRAVGLDENGHLWTWQESLLHTHPDYPDQRRIFVDVEPQVSISLGEDFTPRQETDQELDEEIARQTAPGATLQWMRDEWTKQYRPGDPGFLDTPEGRPVLENMQRQALDQESGTLTRMAAWKKAKIAARAIEFPAEIRPQGKWMDFCIDRVMDGLGKEGRIFALDSEGALWKSGTPDTEPGVRDILHFTLTRMPVQPRLTRIFCRENGWRLLAIDDQHQLWGFGGNNFGELGYGNAGDGIDTQYGHTKPVPEDGFRKLSDKHWAELALGFTFTVGITTSGELWAWGRNMDGECGTGDGDHISHHTAPALVDRTHTWVAVAAGYDTGAAITSTGELYTWGNNGYGVLGEGGITSQRKAPGLTQEPGGWGIGLTTAKR